MREELGFRFALGLTAVLLIDSGLPALLEGQPMPLGGEFRVNTYTTSNQRYAAVSSDAEGDFVVVWASASQDGSGSGVFGQRYQSSGGALGDEFRVNSHTTGSQFFPAVGSDADGDFVVVWNSPSQDGSGDGIFGQRYKGSGEALGAEFQVNAHTTSSQILPAVSSDGDGDFVVVWQSLDQDGGGYGISGQRYQSSGAALGSEFRVNTHIPSNQRNPAVSSAPNGDFVVVWDSRDQDGVGYGIFGQRYQSSGAALGGEFQVNTYSTSSQVLPAVSADAAGDFVVVWQSYTQDGNLYGVFGQRYQSSGAALGSEFRVNTHVPESQILPSVGCDGDGDFVVVWASYTQDGDLYGVFGQLYQSSGDALGGEFRVNTYTTSDQSSPAVGSDANGDFVVVWQSFSQDGSSFGVFGQRLARPSPADTPTPTSSATPTWSGTPTDTSTATGTPSPTPTATATDLLTATPTDTSTAPAGPTSTPTSTGTPADTPTLTPTSTGMPTDTPTATPTRPGIVLRGPPGSGLPLGAALLAALGLGLRKAARRSRPARG